MQKAIIGTKLGMTQVFSPSGLSIPVTVVLAGPCTVIQKKTSERDGYEALKVAFVEQKKERVNKPDLGQFKLSKTAPKKYVRELRMSNADKYEVGSELTCDIFAEGDHVDVSGNTKGRGFTGVIQRHNAARLRMTHGTGPVHRHVGSMGANSSPSRVFKGKKMAGQYGNEKVTIQNLQVVKVDTKRNVLLIRGAIPGPKGALVTVKESVKK